MDRVTGGDHSLDQYRDGTLDLDATADESLDRLVQVCQRASERLGKPLELYHRAALSVRIEQDPQLERSDKSWGREDGVALRVATADNRVRFRAASGFGEGVVEGLIDQVSGVEDEPSEKPWTPSAVTLFDRVASPQQPSVERLELWLGQARQHADVTGPCFIEVATTIESWASSQGGVTSRTRTRSWAVAQPTSGRIRKPLIIAARDWADLAPDGWRQLVDDRRWPNARSASPRVAPATVIFSPETASQLLAALVALGPTDDAEALPVGPGWCLDHVPNQPDALFGCHFDDTGYATRDTRVADGRSWRPGPLGPGSRRRSSYRDRPKPRWFHLAVSPHPVGLPETGVLVNGIDLHPLGPSWLIEFQGGLIEARAPSQPASGVMHVCPETLPSRCFGTLGDSRASHHGVETPALCFRDVDLEIHETKAS